MSGPEVPVLVVDDEPMVREALSRALEEAGYRCTAAANGKEALSQLQKDRYPVMLLDLRMPGMDGIKVLEAVRLRYPDTAVVVVTGVAEVEPAVAAMKAGAADYINKPVLPEDVTIRVGRALERRRLLLENAAYRTQLEQRVEEQREHLKTLFLGAVSSLAAALDARDRYTAGHSTRVAALSAALGTHLHMQEEMRESLRLAGSLHDVGKIALSERVLNKPGRLTPEEYEQVKQHPVVAETILAPLVTRPEILLAVRHHHERWDGMGYPSRLKQEAIPLPARVLGVADAFDAMTSDRPYRPRFSESEALRIIRQETGSHWDPMVVTALEAVRGQ